MPGNGFPRHWNPRDRMKRVHNDLGVSSKDTLSIVEKHLVKGEEAKSRRTLVLGSTLLHPCPVANITIQPKSVA
jgi:hypothetical protein